MERNDVTVFNFPAGDTAIADFRMPNGLVGHTYEQVLNNEAFYMAGWDRQEYESKKGHYLNLARTRIRDRRIVKSNIEGITPPDAFGNQKYIRGVDFGGFGSGLMYRPVDKRENYIKRCVAIAGDVVEIKDRILYVNGEKAPIFPHQQVGPGPVKEHGYYHTAADSTPFQPENYHVQYFPIFPNDPQYNWTEDNFGPLKIPAAGDVVELNHKTLPIYRRIITAYEGHTLKETAEGIFIDGEKVDSYTIQMNYYWLMGDNRNNSADSRFWGFVPEDHVVGRAAFIWMSAGPEGLFNGGARWERVFTGID